MNQTDATPTDSHTHQSYNRSTSCGTSRQSIPAPYIPLIDPSLSSSPVSLLTHLVPPLIANRASHFHVLFPLSASTRPLLLPLSVPPLVIDKHGIYLRLANGKMASGGQTPSCYGRVSRAMEISLLTGSLRMLRADPSLRRGGAAERGGDCLRCLAKKPVARRGGVTVHDNCAVTGALVLSRKILETSLRRAAPRGTSRERRQPHGRPCARSSP